MSGRGRGRGRGGWFGGRGRGDLRHYNELPFVLYPEIEGLGTAEETKASAQLKRLITWTSSLKNYWNSSPYFYEDRRKGPVGHEKVDIERYSDRNLPSAKAKPPLWHFIMLDTDHVPAELARADEKNGPRVKRVCWGLDSDSKRLDDDAFFDKYKHKAKTGEEMPKKEKELEEEEDAENDEDEEEYSDDGDYEQNEVFDDDEDDYNLEEEDNEGPCY